jgi:hypothetical protein
LVTILLPQYGFGTSGWMEVFFTGSERMDDDDEAMTAGGGWE